MFIGPCIVVIVEEWKTNLMSLAILFHFLYTQHVSDINISIIRSLRLCCWITTSLQTVACNTGTTQNQPHQISNTQRTEKKTTDVVIQQHSRKLLMMAILMSETCWTHKKWNKIASDFKLVFHSSTVNNGVYKTHHFRYPDTAQLSAFSLIVFTTDTFLYYPLVLSLYLPVGLFPLDFPTKTLYALLLSSLRATCTPLINLKLITKF